MEIKTLFDFIDYKQYLCSALGVYGVNRGKRSRLAQAIGCQSAFISQVLRGNAHFSLEHAIQISDFLEHTNEETQYFLLLVQLGRAGTKKLEQFYLSQIEDIIKKRQIIRERIQVERGLSSEDQATYYSAWYYSAIHIILSIPKYQTPRAIADYLGLPLALVSKCIEFLVSVGLVTQKGGYYEILSSRIHLCPDSPLISKHHSNWRIRAIQSLEIPEQANLHYSLVLSISESDWKKIRAILLEALEKTEPILRKSKEEAIFGLNLDFFRI